MLYLPHLFSSMLAVYGDPGCVPHQYFLGYLSLPLALAFLLGHLLLPAAFGACLSPGKLQTNLSKVLKDHLEKRVKMQVSGLHPRESDLLCVT